MEPTFALWLPPFPGHQAEVRLVRASDRAQVELLNARLLDLKTRSAKTPQKTQIASLADDVGQVMVLDIAKGRNKLNEAAKLSFTKWAHGPPSQMAAVRREMMRALAESGWDPTDSAQWSYFSTIALQNAWALSECGDDPAESGPLAGLRDGMVSALPADTSALSLELPVSLGLPGVQDKILLREEMFGGGLASLDSVLNWPARRGGDRILRDSRYEHWLEVARGPETPSDRRQEAIERLYSLSDRSDPRWVELIDGAWAVLAKPGPKDGDLAASMISAAETHRAAYLPPIPRPAEQQERHAPAPGAGDPPGRMAV